jgi:threonine dehydrogenase-like Zn-dependent dehydrogenase
MKVVAVVGERKCEIVERDEPRPGGNFAKIRIEAAPMCTEVRQYFGGHPTECLGHEAAGVIVEAGPQCRLSVGQRVIAMPLHGCGTCESCLAGEHILCANPIDPQQACDSPTGSATYAQFCLKADHLLLPVPDDIAIEHASMACCGLGPTFQATQRMGISGSDTVLVYGLGAVGLGGVINAAACGARVIGVEPMPYRADLARALGADYVITSRDTQEVIHTVMELTKGRGVEKSIECSSLDFAPDVLVKTARRRGQIASVGWGGPINAREIVQKGLTLHGCWHWNHQLHAPAMLELIRRNGRKLDQFITHRFPLDRVQEAWELQATGQCGKVILQPQGVKA